MALKKGAYTSLHPGLLRIKILWESAWYMADALPGTERCLQMCAGWMDGWMDDWMDGWLAGCQCRRNERCRFDPWVGKIPYRRKWQPTLVFFPEEFHGQRILVGCSSWGGKESDRTAQSSLRLTSIESVMPSSYLILCRPLLLLPPIPPSIRIRILES